MRARVIITPKEGVRDPQGRAIAGALTRLGFASVEDVRQGKQIELTLNGSDAQAARAEIERMCAQFLVNGVVEDYRIEIG